MAQDCHRQLGEVLEREHVDLAVASEQKRRIEIVAPKPGAIADANRSGINAWWVWVSLFSSSAQRSD